MTYRRDIVIAGLGLVIRVHLCASAVFSLLRTAVEYLPPSVRPSLLGHDRDGRSADSKNARLAKPLKRTDKHR
jgi:hypothetical protein